MVLTPALRPLLDVKVLKLMDSRKLGVTYGDGSSLRPT